MRVEGLGFRVEALGLIAAEGSGFLPQSGRPLKEPRSPNARGSCPPFRQLIGFGSPRPQVVKHQSRKAREIEGPHIAVIPAFMGYRPARTADGQPVMPAIAIFGAESLVGKPQIFLLHLSRRLGLGTNLVQGIGQIQIGKFFLFFPHFGFSLVLVS